MHDPEKSDSGIVAVKPTNKAGQPAAELVEPRPGTKGNAEQQHMHRTQGRARMSLSLGRVRQAARQRKKERFTALLHHVNVDTLRTAFYALKRKAAPGVDGVTWRDYEADLELRLGGHKARTVASQGQHRAIVLALKAAESAVIAEATGLQPVLLLDDVSSELDPDRTRALFAFLGRAFQAAGGPGRGASAGRQIVLTTTRPELIPDALGEGGERRDFQLKRGHLGAAGELAEIPPHA